MDRVCTIAALKPTILGEEWDCDKNTYRAFTTLVLYKVKRSSLSTVQILYALGSMDSQIFEMYLQD